MLEIHAALRVGAAIPSGGFDQGSSLSDNAGPQATVTIDLGARLRPRDDVNAGWMVGGYLGFGLGGMGSANSAALSQSGLSSGGAFSVHVGPEVQYHFATHSNVSPWIGYPLGLEVLHLSAEAAGERSTIPSPDFSSHDPRSASIGSESGFGLGLYAEASFAEFSGGSSWVEQDGVTQGSTDISLSARRFTSCSALASERWCCHERAHDDSEITPVWAAAQAFPSGPRQRPPRTRATMPHAHPRGARRAARSGSVAGRPRFLDLGVGLGVIGGLLMQGQSVGGEFFLLDARVGGYFTRHWGVLVGIQGGYGMLTAGCLGSCDKAVAYQFPLVVEYALNDRRHGPYFEAGVALVPTYAGAPPRATLSIEPRGADRFFYVRLQTGRRISHHVPERPDDRLQAGSRHRPIWPHQLHQWSGDEPGRRHSRRRAGNPCRAAARHRLRVRALKERRGLHRSSPLRVHNPSRASALVRRRSGAGARQHVGEHNASGNGPAPPSQNHHFCVSASRSRASFAVRATRWPGCKSRVDA